MAGLSAVLNLIVKEYDRTSASTVIAHLALPLCPFDHRGTGRAKEVGTRNDFGAAVFGFGDIGEIVVGGKEENGQAYILRWLAFGDEVVGRVVLVPGVDTKAGWRFEGVVVDHVTVGRDQRLGQADNRFYVKEAHIGLAGFKETMGEDQFGVAGVKAIGVVFQCPVEIGAQFSAPVRRENIL